MATQRASAKLGFGSFFPWRLSAPQQVFLLAVAALLALGLFVAALNKTAAIQAPSFVPLQELTEVQRAAQVIPQQPVVEPIVRSENPPAETHSVSAQNEPEAEPGAGAIVPTTWPFVQVEWSEPFLINSLADLPPSLPAGKGFVRETSNGVMNARSTPEAQAYLQKILPQLFASDLKRWPVMAGIARDPTHPNVVAAGFWAMHSNSELRNGERGEFYGFLFLSIDGEKSWYEISSFISDPWANALIDIRVAKEEERIVLYARDPNRVEPIWRKAILSFP